MSTNIGDLIGQGFKPEALGEFLKEHGAELGDSPEEEREESAASQEASEAEPEEVEAAPAVEAEAEEQDAEPEDTAPSMWDQTISEDDPFVTNNFFKGRPLREVMKSAESNFQRSGALQRELDEAKQKLAAFEAVDTYVQRVKEAAERNKPPVDPWKAKGVDLEVDPIANPAKFAQALKEIVAEEVNQRVSGDIAKTREVDSQAQEQTRYETAVASAIGAAKQHLVSKGATPTQIERALPWMMNDIYQASQEDKKLHGGKDPEYLLDPNSYVKAYDYVASAWSQGGDSTSSAPEPAQSASRAKPGAPPGAKKPSASKVATKGSGASLPTNMQEHLQHTVDVLSASGVAGWGDKDAATKFMRDGMAASLGGS